MAATSPAIIAATPTTAATTAATPTAAATTVHCSTPVNRVSCQSAVHHVSRAFSNRHYCYRSH